MPRSPRFEVFEVRSLRIDQKAGRDRENIRAGYVYLLMASFGTIALLLAFGLLAGPEGSYAFAQLRANPPTDVIAAAVLVLARSPGAVFR